MAFPPPVITQAIGLASDCNLKVSDLTGPVSYVTNGVTVSASAFGMSTLYGVWAMDLSVSALNYVRVISPKSAKAKSVVIRWYPIGGIIEAAPGTNLSTEKIRVLALGV
jgi:hypothetical protein